ncbi:probable 2-carboxy-D-arabinitol-1-phosphatase [Nicotiana sylvestris]|uniref:Metal-independent phosphoserine phosphatase-like n=1 Tax=Nicotiana sylvestris TaxID=4096 RepID=A0A1U7VSI6_NICSY|nr:PREDICTED: metal-independent phosphoserine phosphatase-like [Nicotiana sylvestris]
MSSGAILITPYFSFPSISNSNKFPRPKFHSSSSINYTIRCSTSSPELPVTTTERFRYDTPLTGGAFDFEKATTSLTRKALACPKKVTIVRHGLSSWNEEGRVQGSSNLSVLSEKGAMQAERCKTALSDLHFDQCFSSPIARAKTTAEIIWQGKEEPLVFLDSLKEAHLYFLEGMKNEDAKRIYPKEYTTWREDPSNFCVDGVYPLQKLWGRAYEAWEEILLTPGENFLVVTHKSILRALICTALGLGPERFRSVDINNGGLCVFKFNKQGEAMLHSLNMTAHMYTDHIYHY